MACLHYLLSWCAYIKRCCNAVKKTEDRQVAAQYRDPLLTSFLSSPNFSFAHNCRRNIKKGFEFTISMRDKWIDEIMYRSLSFASVSQKNLIAAICNMTICTQYHVMRTLKLTIIVLMNAKLLHIHT